MEIISTHRLSFCVYVSVFSQMLIPLSHGGFASSPDTIQCAISGSSSAHIDGSRDEIPARGIILVLQRDFGG